MSRILYRSLIGHQDFALGPGKVSQERGPNVVNMQKIELVFIFRTVDEIKAVDYTKYAHIGLHQLGAVIEYYYDENSEAIPDDDLVLLPNQIHISQPGRYIKVTTGLGGGTGDVVYTYTDVDYTIQHPHEVVLVDSAVQAITITMPPDPEEDDYVGVWDCGNSAETFPITILRNGKTIQDVAEDALIDVNNSRFDFIWSPLTWEFSFVVGCSSNVTGSDFVYDTIIATCTDEYSPIALSGGIPERTYRASYPLDLTNGYIRIDLTTAPEGAAFIVDIHMNGVSMFSTPIQIDDGSDTSVGSAIPAVLSTTYVPDNAKFEVFVTQIGSVIAGTGLNVAITGVKVP